MSIEHIPENISRIRKSQGYNIQELASKCGLSRQAYSNIENGRAEPKSTTLIKLAEVLNADIVDLLASPPEFSSLRFRSCKSLTKKELNQRQQIIYDVNRWLKDYNDLYRFLDYDEKPFPDIKTKDPQKAAKKIRDYIGINEDEPVIDIMGLLENKLDIKFYLAASKLKQFFGFSIGKEDGGPAIIINTNENISIERKIFTAAHELGHLLLHKPSYIQKETEENEDEEKEANSFAGHFLLPQSGFEKELEETKGLHWIDAILHIKRKFKISYLTVLQRLKDMKYTDNDIYRKFNIGIKQKYGISLKNHNEPQPINSNDDEPIGLVNFDFIEDKLCKLVRDSYEKELITISRAAEILKISMNDMIELNNSWKTISK
jgi:Zn-dependent peptidase ImmA (M78 family)/DNA-binding XRE family transcriptional regulator